VQDKGAREKHVWGTGGAGDKREGILQWDGMLRGGVIERRGSELKKRESEGEIDDPQPKGTEFREGSWIRSKVQGPSGGVRDQKPHVNWIIFGRFFCRHYF
jgi:hypothetical protein